MDLADIRKKANLQSKDGTDVGRDVEKSAPSIQGVPFDEHLPAQQAEAVLDLPEIEEQSPNDSIQNLFNHPFQIDQVEDGDRFEFAETDIDEKRTSRQWLTFSLSGEEYAVDIESVNEIIKPREVTDIPRVPGFMLGIISLRGIVVPIYDLARRLDLGEVNDSNQSRVVVCQHEEKMVGLLVDSITQVVRLNDNKIEPPPPVLSGLNREFVSGVGRDQGRMLILLQLENVLNPELV